MALLTVEGHPHQLHDLTLHEAVGPAYLWAGPGAEADGAAELTGVCEDRVARGDLRDPMGVVVAEARVAYLLLCGPAYEHAYSETETTAPSASISENLGRCSL